MPQPVDRIDDARRAEMARQTVAEYQAAPQTTEEIGWADQATVAMIAEEPW